MAKRLQSEEFIRETSTGYGSSHHTSSFTRDVGYDGYEASKSERGGLSVSSGLGSLRSKLSLGRKASAPVGGLDTPSLYESGHNRSIKLGRYDATTGHESRIVLTSREIREMAGKFIVCWSVHGNLFVYRKRDWKRQCESNVRVQRYQVWARGKATSEKNVD